MMPSPLEQSAVLQLELKKQLGVWHKRPSPIDVAEFRFPERSPPNVWGVDRYLNGPWISQPLICVHERIERDRVQCCKWWQEAANRERYAAHCQKQVQAICDKLLVAARASSLSYAIVQPVTDVRIAHLQLLRTATTQPTAGIVTLTTPNGTSALLELREAQFRLNAIVSELPKSSSSAKRVGNCRYQIGNQSAFCVTEKEDAVLLALIESDGGAATLKELRDKSGYDDCNKVLSQIKKNYPELAPFIILPEAQGRGGYRTTIS
jgi:hypothetical protein